MSISKQVDFFTDLKFMFIEELRDQLSGYIGFYETLLQQKEYIKELIEDCSKDAYQLYFAEADPDEYHSAKKLVVSFETLGYGYELHFNEEDEWGNYCNCTPDMEGYNATHRCCGYSCDSIRPSIRVTKVETVAHLTFQGLERDRWELEKKWDLELKKFDEDKKQKKVEDLERQIKYLVNQKISILNT